MVRLKQVLAFALSWGIIIASSPVGAAPLPSMNLQEAADANLSASQIDELVSPIALYPDALVAQIIAGSTYPDQIVQANSWLQANSKLNSAELMKQVDAQTWDPSVKALTQFPSVLDNMAKNLSWTSALGDAAYNQQADVMAAVQRLRKQAKDAGNLKTTSQQTVKTETQQGQQVIVIQPANPQVVYVPTYNPTVVYGTPYSPPGYSTGAMVATGIISFGVGMAVGAAINNSCCGWGWNSWGCGWHGGSVTYNRNVYVSRSNVYANGNRYHGGYNGARPRPTPYGSNVNRSGNRNTNVSGNTVNINNGGNRNNINSGNRNPNINSGNRNPNNNIGNNNRPGGNNRNLNNRPGGNGGNLNNGAGANRPTTRPAQADRGYGQKAATGTKSGAFSGYSSGGNARADANRGKASTGGANRSAPSGGNRGGGGGGRRR